MLARDFALDQRRALNFTRDPLRSGNDILASHQRDIR
jgi:hypothetical protein